LSAFLAKKQFPLFRNALSRPAGLGISPDGASILAGMNETPSSAKEKRVRAAALFTALCVSAALATSAQAQSQCTRDVLATIQCRDAYGTTFRETRDALGNTTWTDGRGYVIRQSADALGATTTSDSDGYVTRETIDALGNVTWSDSAGRVVHQSWDALGSWAVTDGEGGAGRCSTDALGNTTCR
jgi:hypothetical protein